MKNYSDSESIGDYNPINSGDLHDRLLQIYWDKKNLEEFLPQIAKYSTVNELVAITLSQLAMIENQLIWVMREITNAKI